MTKQTEHSQAGMEGTPPSLCCHLHACLYLTLAFPSPLSCSVVSTSIYIPQHAFPCTMVTPDRWTGIMWLKGGQEGDTPIHHACLISSFSFIYISLIIILLFPTTKRKRIRTGQTSFIGWCEDFGGENFLLSGNFGNMDKTCFALVCVCLFFALGNMGDKE